MKRLFYILLFSGFAHLSIGQITDVKTNYELAFGEMHQMLKGETPISFKRAVFLTENAYMDNQLSYEDFQEPIKALARMTQALVTNDGLDYNKKDKRQALLAASIYRVMKDTLTFKGTNFQKFPYTYDTADFWGAKDWTKMFVTKLIYTQTGNCHSLPLLYKILADELGAEAYLSVTPNHTYIKQWNDKIGWYNTELTSGRFPYDAEIKNNSYIKHEAIVNGVYMDTLTSKENISYAITDLAQGFIKKFGYDDIETPVRWLDAALVYYPDFPNALILKSELLKKRYENLAAEKGEKDFLKPKDSNLKKKFEELEKSYYSVHKIEYRRMPKEMYLNWLYRVRKDTTRKPHRFESPQPFKDYNYKVTVMTASDGYNYEFYDQEDTTRIGTVIINRLSGKIVKFVDPSKDDFPDEVISRMYDPYVGRFWQVDPKSHLMPSISPYAFAFNNPMRFIDPDGQYPIDIVTRSYAPFKTFGPFFARYHGDDRGHSLDRNASYRTSATINYDTETNKRSVAGGRSLSYKAGTSPEDGTYSNTYTKDRSDGNKLDVHSYGNNADQPGSWDIDQFTKLEVGINGDIKGDHVLNITGAISGDDFPNQESMVYDSKGNGLWLGNFATSGGEGTGPTMDLAKENEKDVHIKVNISIKVNADGIFQGVMQGNKMISIEDWNKQFKSNGN